MRPSLPSWAVQVLLAAATVAGSLLVYLPYRDRMQAVYAFWDGPSYLAIAHEGYAVRPGNPLAPDPSQPPYYASHPPGYPILIRGLSFLGYENALLAGAILPSIAAVLIFYRLARDVWRLPSPGFLSMVFLFLPPRWVLYRSVGASEPLYIAMVLASVWYFEKSKVGAASLAGGLAAVTRFPGLLMLPSYAWLLHRRKASWRTLLWLALIPAGVALYFLYFIRKFGDPLLSVDRNLELISSLIPFWDLTRITSWPDRQNHELYILLTLLYVVGVFRLYRKYPIPFAYCVPQLAFVLLLSGGDWTRYYLAMAPFALILGFHDVLNTRAFRWAFPVYALLSVFWASQVIPMNQCEVYDRVVAFLGI